MIWLRRVPFGVWDFVVGDDWRLALGAIVAIGGAAILVDAGINGWWFAPLAIPGILGLSLRGAMATARSRPREAPPSATSS
jgi:hypothetical protein